MPAFFSSSIDNVNELTAPAVFSFSLLGTQHILLVRDWSLITGRGATKREGVHVKFYPYENGGRKKF